MNQAINSSRRTFLKVAGLSGGGLVVGFSLGGCAESLPALAHKKGSFTPNAFLQINPDNAVRFICPRDEMGQGVSTGLATLVGEELDINPHDLIVEFARVHEAYNNPDFGMQGTGGSTSIKVHFLPIRQAAATARESILNAAAQQLGVTRDKLTTSDGHVVVGEQHYPYGQFSDYAAAQPLSENARLKPKSEFKYIGKHVARIDALGKSTGTAVYGMDVDLPDMHHAVVVRCPVAGGKLQSFNAEKARQQTGVSDIVEIDSGVAVVAEKFWQAKKAAALVEVDWQLGELAKVSDASLKQDYQAALAETGDTSIEQGDVTEGFANAQKTVEQSYWAPYLAHSPMEPMNAVVKLDGDKAELWTGSQFPASAAGVVARYAGIDKDQVSIHQTYLGGGFGRRAMVSHVVEATQAAKATGKTIQVVWTREDDIRHGFYRPASLMNLRAGVNKAGEITAWSVKRVGANILPSVIRDVMPGNLPNALPVGAIRWMGDMAAKAFDGWIIDHPSVEGFYEAYDFPNLEVKHVTVDHGLPLAYWRSVGHSFSAFAKESMIDELALTAGMDAVELRLKNCQNNPRMAGVIAAAAKRMKQLQAGSTNPFGFAAHYSFNTYVAQAAEVSLEAGNIKVHKVICAVDCGQVINPDIVKGQMEGAIMFGLTAALHGDIKLKNGAVQQSNFHDYPILRMNEAPEVEVILIDSDEAPTGVGEPGLPPIAAAVANGVFAASGQRLRSLPLKLA